jgi:hypothetical protein
MATNAEDQIAFVHKLTTDTALRNAFIANPAGIEQQSGITLDNDLREEVVHSIGQVRDRASELINRNPFVIAGGPQINPGQVMNAVVEAAAVVAASAAVVSAVTAVYQATKFDEIGQLDRQQLTRSALELNAQVRDIASEVALKRIGSQRIFLP